MSAFSAEMKQKRLDYIQNDIMYQIKVHHQIEHPTIRTVQFLEDTKQAGEDQFQSISIFGQIVYEYEPQSDHEKSTTKIVDVIIKLQIGDESSLRWNNGGVQFYNEILFYNDLIPYFKTVVPNIDDTFPKYFFGHIGPSTSVKRFEDIIILENLFKQSYTLTESRAFLSLEHILLAMEHLGKLHACSYILKTNDKINFTKKIDLIKNTRRWVSDSNDQFQCFLARNAERGYKYLQTLPKYCEKLDNLKQFIDNIDQNIVQLFQVNEKTAVLCHGDFCRNNMFYKYATQGESRTNESPDSGDQVVNELNKRMPVSVKLFDMATIMYCSPVLDITFFLYLNTSQELRVKHWNTMIETYYRSIRQETDRFDEVQVPTYEELKEELRSKAMMGYLTCAFFLPIMLQEEREDRTFWGKMSSEELIQHRLKTGGEKASKAIGDILIHMIDNEFI